MKVLKIIVDSLPENCKECIFSFRTPFSTDIKCMMTNEIAANCCLLIKEEGV